MGRPRGGATYGLRRQSSGRSQRSSSQAVSGLMHSTGVELQMECVDDPLTVCQLEAIKKGKEDHRRATKMIEMAKAEASRVATEAAKAAAKAEALSRMQATAKSASPDLMIVGESPPPAVQMRGQVVQVTPPPVTSPPNSHSLLSNMAAVPTSGMMVGPGVVPQQVFRFVNFNQHANTPTNLQPNQWFLRPIMPVIPQQQGQLRGPTPSSLRQAGPPTIVSGTSGLGIKRPFTMATSANLSPVIPKRPRGRPSADADMGGGNWVPLDEYYYGKMEGDPTYTEEKSEFRFKCWMCTKMLYNNVKAMMHLQGHIDSEKQQNLDLSDLTQCKHCYKQFDTPFEMQTHIEKVHLNNVNVLMCRICEKDHESRTALTTHMRQNHCACEMPYTCQLCNFRSSMYSDVVDHFKKKHDSSNNMLCLYCLRVFNVKFVSQGWGQTQTYYHHLLRHQTKSGNKKCAFCKLSFFNPIDMKQHRKACHQPNQKGVIGVNAKYSTPDQVMIKVPETGIITKKSGGPKSLNAPTISKVMEHRGLRLPRATAVASCFECKMLMNTSDHYKKYIQCSMCRFATSCSFAYATHMMGFHSGQLTSLAGSTPWERPMAAPLYCACGFSSKLANRIATHLVSCSKRTCYVNKPEPPPDKAASDEQTDPRRKPDASILDALGLVKKQSLVNPNADSHAEDSQGQDDPNVSEMPATQEPAATESSEETAGEGCTSRPTEGASQHAHKPAPSPGQDAATEKQEQSDVTWASSAEKGESMDVSWEDSPVEASSAESGEAESKAADGKSGEAESKVAVGKSGEEDSKAADGKSGEAESKAADGKSGEEDSKAADGKSGEEDSKAADGKSGEEENKAADGKSGEEDSKAADGKSGEEESEAPAAPISEDDKTDMQADKDYMASQAEAEALGAGREGREAGREGREAGREGRETGTGRPMLVSQDYGSEDDNEELDRQREDDIPVKEAEGKETLPDGETASGNEGETFPDGETASGNEGETFPDGETASGNEGETLPDGETASGNEGETLSEENQGPGEVDRDPEREQATEHSLDGAQSLDDAASQEKDKDPPQEEREQATEHSQDGAQSLDDAASQEKDKDPPQEEREQATEHSQDGAQSLDDAASQEKDKDPPQEEREQATEHSQDGAQSLDDAASQEKDKDPPQEEREQDTEHSQDDAQSLDDAASQEKDKDPPQEEREQDTELSQDEANQGKDRNPSPEEREKSTELSRDAASQEEAHGEKHTEWRSGGEDGATADDDRDRTEPRSPTHPEDSAAGKGAWSGDASGGDGDRRSGVEESGEGGGGGSQDPAPGSQSQPEEGERARSEGRRRDGSPESGKDADRWSGSSQSQSHRDRSHSRETDSRDRSYERHRDYSSSHSDHRDRERDHRRDRDRYDRDHDRHRHHDRHRDQRYDSHHGRHQQGGHGTRDRDRDRYHDQNRHGNRGGQNRHGYQDRSYNRGYY
ncbi:filaggrin-like isoform X2 [Littorina saxatilis]|uniref:C2H2-type domain-containing protein n=1 Tax=Littorina saxatilis TaxID=31220 RepID=A0AAN9G5I4_9CAEN